MPQADLHDGSTIEIEVYGQGPTLLLPVNPHPVTGELAEQMRAYGTDPALGQSLINGLSDIFRVVAFDYEGQVQGHPKPETLTPENAANDLLAIADAVGANQFAYYGYSWLAVIGLQLAIRTRRLSALIMGGYPPLHGPYADMLRVTTIAYELANGTRSLQTDDGWTTGSLSESQTRQFVTLYEALKGFDDEASQNLITCPRLCFVGSADEIHYDANWDNTHVDIAGPVVRGQADLERLGWDVRVLPGLDHIQAMQPTHVVPLLRTWWKDSISA